MQRKVGLDVISGRLCCRICSFGLIGPACGGMVTILNMVTNWLFSMAQYIHDDYSLSICIDPLRCGVDAARDIVEEAETMGGWKYPPWPGHTK